MKIHNVMEEVIISTVNDIYNEEESSVQFGFCTCRQCRLDVVCYVLNRVNPQYVISGKGLAHYETETQKNIQRNIDLVALAHQGIQKISNVRRPGCIRSEASHHTTTSTHPVFKFPTIAGRVFNGKTFEPISGLDIQLLTNDEAFMPMIDANWQNPYRIDNNTSGNYIFWPAPVTAKKKKIKKNFRLHLKIDNEIMGQLDHFFEIELESSADTESEMQIEATQKIEDLYLFG